MKDGQSVSLCIPPSQAWPSAFLALPVRPSTNLGNVLWLYPRATFKYLGQLLGGSTVFIPEPQIGQFGHFRTYLAP